MTETIDNPHWGSTLEDFLDEEGIREEASMAAIRRVIAWQMAPVPATETRHYT